MSTSAVQNLAPAGRTPKLIQPGSAPQDPAESFEHALADARERDAAKPRETRKPDPQPKAAARKSKSTGPAGRGGNESATPADSQNVAGDEGAEPPGPEGITAEESQAVEVESPVEEAEQCEADVEDAAAPGDPLALPAVSAPQVPAGESEVVQEVQREDVTTGDGSPVAIEKLQTHGGAARETQTSISATGAPPDPAPGNSPHIPASDGIAPGEAANSPTTQAGKPFVRGLGAQEHSENGSSTTGQTTEKSTPSATTPAAFQQAGTESTTPTETIAAPSTSGLAAMTETPADGEPNPQANLAPPSTAQPAASAKTAQPAAPATPPPETHFAESNHDRIVTGVRTQLLPNGGSMQIRLDPPELGALQVMVEMRDGVMTATFQTSSDEATRLLSHSLNHLKGVLESQGVGVERLQVQQAPKNDSSNAGDDARQQQQNWSDDHASRQEQERKELLKRMWRKISGNEDPLDLVA